MRNGFFGLSLGAMDVPFTDTHLQPGFRAGEIRTPPAAFQITLLGHQFNPYISADMTYTRPMKWANFDNINGGPQGHSAWVVLGEFKLRGRVPIADRLWLYGDAGIALTSRHGAKNDAGAVVIGNANYPAFLTGGGLQYQVNPRWSFLAGITRTSGSEEDNHPRSLLVTTGVRYHLSPLPADQVAAAARSEYLVPANTVQVAYAASLAGRGLNDFFSSTVPIFWGGSLQVDHGFRVSYERNLFHTKRWIAFDMGISGARWHAQKSEEHLASVSFYPQLRFFLVRTPSADMQITYSVASPTILSQTTQNGAEIGTTRFSFQDLMGISIVAGRNRRTLIGLGIGHYSNGNLLPVNAGVAIPLTISLGYAF